MFCFTNILNIFSFVTCSMHKNPHQNVGNGIKETLFFKIFLGSMPPDPLRSSRTFGASRANPCPPPPPPISPVFSVSGKFFAWELFLVANHKPRVPQIGATKRNNFSQLPTAYYQFQKNFIKITKNQNSS